jgi:hypothetical protein
MSDSDTYRRRAEVLLRKAAEAANMKERSRLIDEAMHWHMLAMEARNPRDRASDLNDNDEDQADDRGVRR